MDLLKACLALCIALQPAVCGAAPWILPPVPAPVRFVAQPERRAIVLPATPGVVAPSASSGAFKLLQRELGAVRVSARAAHVIVLRLDRSLTALGSEGYRIDAGNGRAVVTAADERGLYYGAQTLLQLVVKGKDGTRSIGALKVEDHPRFAWRGLLVDVSRHFFPKEAIFRILDEMAAYKLNVLHLHLTDDPGWRIEIPGYPKLTQLNAPGGRSGEGIDAPAHYTATDIREIVAYAAERHIEVIPEIDMPGHSAAAARAYPEFFDGNKSVNPGNPATYAFIEDVLGAVAALFPSQYIHFGGDELRQDNWDTLPEVKTLMREHGLKDKLAVEGYFGARVAEIIRRLGKKPMAWDEAVTAGVDNRVLVQWWRKLKPEVRDSAAAAGYELVLSPADRVYFDYPQAVGEPGAPWEGNDKGPTTLESVLAWEPVPESFSKEEAAKVRGVEAALWTEFIASERYLQYMLYPRLQAFAEVAWGQKGPKDPEDFKLRLQPHLDRLESKGFKVRRNEESGYEFMTH